jgi:hypothetical protein
MVLRISFIITLLHNTFHRNAYVALRRRKVTICNVKIMCIYLLAQYNVHNALLPMLLDPYYCQYNITVIQLSQLKPVYGLEGSSLNINIQCPCIQGPSQITILIYLFLSHSGPPIQL